MEIDRQCKAFRALERAMRCKSLGEQRLAESWTVEIARLLECTAILDSAKLEDSAYWSER